MASNFPNGTILAISSGFNEAVQVTGITNANPAVASATSPPSNGSIGVLASGWTDANDRAFRTSGSTSNTFKLDGVDATDTKRYPAGAGAGSFKTVKGWVQLSQVREMSVSGGEQQFYQFQYLEDRNSRQRQAPTFKNAMAINVTLDNDPALPWFAALVAADAKREPVILRATLPNGAELYYYVYPSFNSTPSMTMNENMTNMATFSLIGEITRYEA